MDSEKDKPEGNECPTGPGSTPGGSNSPAGPGGPTSPAGPNAPSAPADPAGPIGTTAPSAVNRRDGTRHEMMRSLITEPLLSQVQNALAAGFPEQRFEVIIALNEFYAGGIKQAMEKVQARADQWKVPYKQSTHYLFAELSAFEIKSLAAEARQLARDHGPNASVIYRIWEDATVELLLTRSLTTIKADAAQRAFQALGDNIVWAVLDSGIDAKHPHFKSADPLIGPIDTLAVTAPLDHMDYTPAKNGALTDEFGHGTHVAGIIAGYWKSAQPKGEATVGLEERDESTNQPVVQRGTLGMISGIAPKCKLVSMKVAADHTSASPPQNGGQGKVSWILQAIDQIQEWNQHGKRLLIHGVNMSIGYDFDPRWFACGHSPICVEVNRLVKCGVAVVVSAGNGGYGTFFMGENQPVARFLGVGITDPGNADLALTVGATHRDMPHMYGVSYFSSRGPTGDGRLKPDLVAPGERIVSCAAGAEAQKFARTDASGKLDLPLYCEQSGTSMAAPHVSGAIAAFLSVRREFIGEPERVKEIFLSNAIDLRRERSFQGAGLVDLMKVLQAV